jgi:hypothetical protein
MVKRTDGKEFIEMAGNPAISVSIYQEQLSIFAIAGI